jgi:crossover junction endodeoxyribonuclease RuvC
MGAILGVDPGVSGAFALLDTRGELIEVFPVPSVNVDKSRKRTVVAEVLLARKLSELAPFVDTAAVEEASAMPRQGVASTFTFGMAYGTVCGILAGLGIPVVRVPPAVWKKDMKLGKNKDESRLLAMRVWPSRADGFSRRKDHGSAEAALIALWLYERKTR